MLSCKKDKVTAIKLTMLLKRMRQKTDYRQEHYSNLKKELKSNPPSLVYQKESINIRLHDAIRN